MGGSNSKEKPKYKNVDLYKLMGGSHNNYFSEQNTINFSRKDLVNTLSSESIMNVIHNGGGEKLKRIPSRDRYSKYETQQIKSHNQNLHGGNQFSSVSEQEIGRAHV